MHIYIYLLHLAYATGFRKLLNMKKLLIILLLYPCVLSAQTEHTDIPEQKLYKNEAGINSGLVLTTRNGLEASYVPVNLKYMRNIGKTQVGLVFEYYINISTLSPATNGNGGFSPILIFNRVHHADKYYLYAGAAAGYYQEWSSISAFPTQGYTLGAQGGIMMYLGKHFGLNAELGIRSTQTFRELHQGYYNPNTGAVHISDTYIIRDFFLNIPITLGIRYRF